MKIETPKLLLPRTGQTTSYATGDDGDLQAGNPRATRFVDNGNGTVTDRATGLHWVKDVSDLGTAFYAGGAFVTMTWADAVANCLALSYAGFSDWRLPNMTELLLLVDRTRSAPMIDPLFTNMATIVNGWHWSSTTPHTTAYACGTSFTTFGISQWAGKTNTFLARPVRGGRING